MGSSTGQLDEQPLHEVTLSPFYIDRTEVTVAAYGRCVSSGACSAPEVDQACNWRVRRRNDHPVNCVDWMQASAYCAWTGGRLPTEAEWEFAARGTDDRVFPWGQEPPSAQLCWSGRNYRSGTCAVGTFPGGASPFGVLDMAGNVWEWTSDWYGMHTAAAATNPTGARAGRSHVARGGAWYGHDAARVRATYRNWFSPGDHFDYVGFRCARDVPR